jgi:hypothetical protein
MFIFLGEKFELKLLKASGVMLHEEVEESRYERLYNRLQDEGVLYNPLIVGRYKNKYVLIDGANRYQALKKLGAKTILAQIVDYKSDELKLKSWYHFVNNMTFDDLKIYLEGRGLKYSKWNIKSRLDKLNYIGVAGASGKGIKIKLSKKLDEMLKSLSAINKYYENNFGYTRIDSDADLSNLKRVFPGSGLLFVFPMFPKQQIVKIAANENKVPAGITRHLLPNRVLRIKFEIEKLMTDENLDGRNKELDLLIRQKAESKKVRLYKEPLLIFDE